MRLDCVESGHDPLEAQVLELVRTQRGAEPPDVLKTLHYRPELFGRPFSEALDLAMRGPSDWTDGERELFAAFVSSVNQCPFWTGSHGAVASYALGEEVWEAVRLDWQTAPVDERLRAMLGFLEKLTLEPGKLTRADADEVLSTGVSEQALVDAIHVAALFNMIDRLADSLGWHVPSDEAFFARAQAMLESGYALATLPGNATHWVLPLSEIGYFLPVRAERLLPTRVYRFYRGGALLGQLRGEPGEDDFFPEDWIGSVTAARNPGRDDPREGLSRLADGRILRDAVEADPIAWLGEEHVARFGTSTGLLVKLLDSAERLPVHAHPDRAFAREAFDSQFGKTEAWIVLDTRDGQADVWVGLRDPVEAERYLEWIEEQDVDRLLHSLNRISVRPGDLVYVPAGVPHALGAGVLIAELQEPTDFSFLCEWRGFPIRPEDSHLGLGWDAAVHALDLSVHEPLRDLPPEARSFFWADRQVEAIGRFMVLLVVEGEGRIDGAPTRPGAAFAVPAAVERILVEGDVRVLRCLGPDPRG